MCTVDHSLFTYSRRQRSHMVAEHSTLSANSAFPRFALPLEFYVQGARRRVLYKRAPNLDVKDRGGEDYVAFVYVPTEDKRVLPQVHVLNT